MTTETEELEKPEVEEVEQPEAETSEVETPSTDQEPEAKDEYADRAQRMGWVPKEKFRGDPDRWVDAKTFVEKGENELPILRERLRKQDEALREVNELKRDFKQHITRVEQRAYDKARRELEAEREAAKDVGDFEKYDKATKQLTELDKEKPEDKPEDTAPVVDPLKDPVFSDWAARNSWFQTDPERATYANTYGEYLNRTKPHLNGRAFLDEITKAVSKEFPDRFENPRRTATPKVEGGGVAPKGRSSGKTFDDLPAEAKAACVRYEKQGVMKRDEYVKDYFSE